MAGNGWKWPEIAKIAENGWTWREMAGNGCKSLELLQRTGISWKLL